MERDRGGIRKFLDGSTILVTGGTGFLGKLLVEKLLRLTLATRIYLLIRCKKGKTEAQRYDEIFEQPIFNDLKKQQPNFIERLGLITGDCVLPDLGISEENRHTLTNEVNVIFHCAATVRFDQKLKTATYINIRATSDLISMAKDMKDLKAFVHVSTAYANCPRQDIDEVFYKPGLEANKLTGLLNLLDDEQIEACTPNLLGKWPNTYAFTKCISEDVIKKEAVGLPMALVRPSMVTSTYKEPLCGWIDNFYGPVGVSYGVALGLLRTLHAIPENLADMVPADYVVNVLLAAAWQVSNRKQELGPEEIQDVSIYNFVSTPEAPIDWNTYMGLCYKYGVTVPSPRVIWHPVFTLNRYKWKHELQVFLLHWIPAYIVDGIATCIGKKPMMVDGYKKIHNFIGVIHYFTNRQWNFSNDNTKRLWSQLGDSDRRLFEFSMSDLDWDDYFRTYLAGARVYLLKDPMDTVPAGRRWSFFLKWAHYSLVTFIIFVVVYVVFRAIF